MNFETGKGSLRGSLMEANGLDQSRLSQSGIGASGLGLGKENNKFKQQIQEPQVHV